MQMLLSVAQLEILECFLELNFDHAFFQRVFITKFTKKINLIFNKISTVLIDLQPITPPPHLTHLWCRCVHRSGTWHFYTFWTLAAFRRPTTNRILLPRWKLPWRQHVPAGVVCPGRWVAAQRHPRGMLLRWRPADCSNLKALPWKQHHPHPPTMTRLVVVVMMGYYFSMIDWFGSPFFSCSLVLVVVVGGDFSLHRFFFFTLRYDFFQPRLGFPFDSAI